MTRYRLALIAVVALAIGAVALALVRAPAPPSPAGGGTAADLFPFSQRIAAPDFTGIDGWINSSPLQISRLRGRVVLVDFWTFSCVNCVRTIPHLRQEYDLFRSHGFLIVGVHSPEFDFEKVPANVAAAVRRLDITWPVAIDSEMATWRAYGNEVWPAEYLIDQQGRIAYVNFGEGNYAQAEAAEAALLGLSGSAVAATSPPASDITPELYAGSDRGHLADGEQYAPPGQASTYPDRGPPRDRDAILVTGAWTDQGQHLQADAPGHVRLLFHASDLFVVAGTAAGPISGEVTLDGVTVAHALSGPAVTGGSFRVASEDLYHLLAGVGPGYHLLDLSVPADFQLYTFTFG